MVETMASSFPTRITCNCELCSRIIPMFDLWHRSVHSWLFLASGSVPPAPSILADAVSSRLCGRKARDFWSAIHVLLRNMTDGNNKFIISGFFLSNVKELDGELLLLAHSSDRFSRLQCKGAVMVAHRTLMDSGRDIFELYFFVQTQCSQYGYPLLCKWTRSAVNPVTHQLWLGASDRYGHVT